jgi:hypothetical protein
VICTLESPLANSLIIEDLPPIFAGERLLTLATSPDRVPAILQQVMKAATVQEIRTEEVDFEEVIRRFLERERGV